MHYIIEAVCNDGNRKLFPTSILDSINMKMTNRQISKALVRVMVSHCIKELYMIKYGYGCTSVKTLLGFHN